MILESKLKSITLNSVLVVIAVFLAIGIKAVMPASVNVEDFDSFLVQSIGFPLVAVMYFVLLFVHCIMTMRYFGTKSGYSNLSVGLAYGLAFFLMYLVGMQEVVVEASPYDVWGIEFVVYQFIIGISDSVPVLLLCVISAYFTLGKGTTLSPRVKEYFDLKAFIAIVASFIFIRTIGYETGLITSNCDTFPMACYVWTLLFGITLGGMYFILYPFYLSERRRFHRSFYLVVVTLGFNWILFNSFIGFIMSGTIGQMILRSSIDVLVLFIVSLVFDNKVTK